jgi:hypothetical protein
MGSMESLHLETTMTVTDIGVQRKPSDAETKSEKVKTSMAYSFENFGRLFRRPLPIP